MRFLTILKIVAILVILALFGLLAFAYLGDLSPRQVDILEPVTIDAD